METETKERYRIKSGRVDEFIAVYSAHYEHINRTSILYLPDDLATATAQIKRRVSGYVHVDFDTSVYPMANFIFNEYFEKVED